MSFLKVMAASIAGLVLLSGCASSPSNVDAQYVSDVQYKSYTCDEVEEELARVSARVTEVARKQSNAASADAVSMTVGLVIFWPALFALAATDDHSPELGRLKGEYEALERVARKRHCTIEALPVPQIEEPKVNQDAIRPNA